MITGVFERGSNPLRWLARALQYPPQSLKELEYTIGPLDVGPHEIGLVVRSRPAERGLMRGEVAYLNAQFAYSLNHGPPSNHRLQSFDLRLDLDHATVARMLEEHFGVATREVTTPHGSFAEYGSYFYLGAGHDGSVDLRWSEIEPEWALPPVSPGSREALLRAWIDRLGDEDTIAPIVAALEPLVGPAGCKLSTPRNEILISFRPGMELATMVAIFGWEMPVASSGDVQLSGWQVAPLEAERPAIGRWTIAAHLDSWPRGPNGAALPKLGRCGPSPLLDARTAVSTIVAIRASMPPRAVQAPPRHERRRAILRFEIEKPDLDPLETPEALRGARPYGSTPIDRTPVPLEAWLVQLDQDGCDGERHALRTETRIGRVVPNCIVLPEGNVSMRHARILFVNGRFMVVDLRSVNGTFLDEARVAIARPLVHGNVIRIGRFRFRFELGSSRPE